MTDADWLRVVGSVAGWFAGACLIIGAGGLASTWLDANPPPRWASPVLVVGLVLGGAAVGFLTSAQALQ